MCCLIGRRSLLDSFRCYNVFSNLQLHQADDTLAEPSQGYSMVQLAAGEIGSVTGTALQALDVARREGTMLSPSSSHCCFCTFCLPKIFKEFQRHWKGDESCLFSACASIVVIIQTSEISKILLVAPVYYRRSLSRFRILTRLNLNWTACKGESMCKLWGQGMSRSHMSKKPYFAHTSCCRWYARPWCVERSRYLTAKCPVFRQGTLRVDAEWEECCANVLIVNRLGRGCCFLKHSKAWRPAQRNVLFVLSWCFAVIRIVLAAEGMMWRHLVFYLVSVVRLIAFSTAGGGSRHHDERGDFNGWLVCEAIRTVDISH